MGSFLVRPGSCLGLQGVVVSSPMSFWGTEGHFVRGSKEVWSTVPVVCGVFGRDPVDTEFPVQKPVCSQPLVAAAEKEGRHPFFPVDPPLPHIKAIQRIFQAYVV